MLAITAHKYGSAQGKGERKRTSGEEATDVLLARVSTPHSFPLARKPDDMRLAETHTQTDAVDRARRVWLALLAGPATTLRRRPGSNLYEVVSPKADTRLGSLPPGLAASFVGAGQIMRYSPLD